MDSPIDCQFLRRFGIELEVNTLTGIIKRPDSDYREIPVGSDYVSNLVNKATRERVELQGWDHIHNNKCWIVKPDMSCCEYDPNPAIPPSLGWLCLLGWIHNPSLPEFLYNPNRVF